MTPTSAASSWTRPSTCGSWVSSRIRSHASLAGSPYPGTTPSAIPSSYSIVNDLARCIVDKLSELYNYTGMRSRRVNQKVAVGVVYVAALFMAIMDTTIVNVALPVLGRDFHTSPDAVDSVVIGFLVSTGVFLAASGWLGDRVGGRKILLFSVVLFTVASALCGTATSLGELVVFRVLQGAGGGLMTPVGMAMLFRVFPPAER